MPAQYSHNPDLQEAVNNAFNLSELAPHAIKLEHSGNIGRVLLGSYVVRSGPQSQNRGETVLHQTIIAALFGRDDAADKLTVARHVTLEGNNVPRLQRKRTFQIGGAQRTQAGAGISEWQERGGIYNNSVWHSGLLLEEMAHYLTMLASGSVRDATTTFDGNRQLTKVIHDLGEYGSGEPMIDEAIRRVTDYPTAASG